MGTTVTETITRILPEGLHAATIAAVTFDANTETLRIGFENEKGEEAVARFFPNEKRMHQLTKQISAPLTLTFDAKTLSLTGNLHDLIGNLCLIVVEHIVENSKVVANVASMLKRLWVHKKVSSTFFDLFLPISVCESIRTSYCATHMVVPKTRGTVSLSGEL